MTSFFIGPTGREQDSSSCHTCSQYFVCTYSFISGTSATFSPVLPRLPIFTWLSVENEENPQDLITSFVSQGDELHQWIQMFHDFPQQRPLFHRLKETSFVTSSNAWSRRTVPAWKTPFAPGPRCGCKRCGEPWMASAVPMSMP